MSTHLLQKASQFPLGLMAVKFLASLIRICNSPFVAFFVDKDDLLNFRRLRLPFSPPPPLVVCADSGGTNFKATIISPLYTGDSSNCSLCK